MLGAFLENSDDDNEFSWLTPELITAANWLKHHNLYLKPFADLLSTPSFVSKHRTGPFPRARHSPHDQRAPAFHERETVVPAINFSTEIHNEHFHYSHLVAGFVRTSSTTLPLSFNDPDLEPLLFPDLFPDGRGHYHDQYKDSIQNDSVTPETYGKYIKHRLLCVDPRFRLHPYWPSYSYLQLEKLRNHQNATRLWH